MKKEYRQPQAKTYTIKASSLIMASITSSSLKVSSGITSEQCAKGFGLNFSDDEDEE